MPVEAVERLLLPGCGGSIDIFDLVVFGEGHGLLTSDDVLDGLPPDFPNTIDKSGWHIERERRFVAEQDRQGVLQVVAIGIVEGENDEGAPLMRRGEALERFIEGNDVDAEI